MKTRDWVISRFRSLYSGKNATLNIRADDVLIVESPYGSQGGPLRSFQDNPQLIERLELEFEIMKKKFDADR
jgi:hypothetical protein